MKDYEQFKKSKLALAKAQGIDARDQLEKYDWLSDFQKDVDTRCLKMGASGMWLDTGLGKSRLEMAAAQIVAEHTGKPSLILTPLAVVGQFLIEAKKCPGVEVCRLGESGTIQVTNYQKLHLISPDDFGGVWFDEGSIFKGDGTTKRACEAAFSRTQFKCSASATPFPNDQTEIGRQAEVLGVMSQQAMLSRWFVHDSANTSEWRLKKHAVQDFWHWVSTWAVVARLPSDLGYSDEGYILPPLTVTPIVINTLDEFEEAAKLSATNLHVVKRETAQARALALAERVNEEADIPWMILCDTDYEAVELRKVLPLAVEVKGGMNDDKKEELLLGFPQGKFLQLLSKDSIVGWGLNYQHCRRIALVGASFSFERVYQVIRRCWRFGQTEHVEAFIFNSDQEWSILDRWQKKAIADEESKTSMVAAMKQTKHLTHDLTVTSTGDDAQGSGWKALRGDCVERIKEVETASIGYSIFSPPFSGLYLYSDLLEDMGNSADDDEFFRHFSFLVPELKRIMIPGRLVSIHCMDLPSSKEKHGYIGLRDFPGEIIKLFVGNGFVYHSRVTIWKDPLIAAVRTKALGLLHKQVIKDSAKSRQGCADYLITFKVPGENPQPVSHGDGFERYIGEDAPTEDKYIKKGPKPPKDPELNVKYSHEVWQRYASPVWADINQTDVLPFTGARAAQDERHVCPLQKQVIERGIELWSNPGDTVFTPFGGVGSEGYVAVQMGRKAILIELKESYFDQLRANMSQAAENVQMDLFNDDLP